MRRHRQDQEQVIRKLLARLGDEAGDPTEAELRRAARAGRRRRPNSPGTPGFARTAVAPAPPALGCGRRGDTARRHGPRLRRRLLAHSDEQRADGRRRLRLPTRHGLDGDPGRAPRLRRVDARGGCERPYVAWRSRSRPATGASRMASVDNRYRRDAEGSRRAGPGRRLSVAEPALDPGGREAGHGAGTADPRVRAPCGRQRLQRRCLRHLRQRAHGRDVREGGGADRASRRRSG